MNLQGTGLDLSTQVGSKCQGGTASLLDFGHYSSALQDREPIGLEFPGLHNRLHQDKAGKQTNSVSLFEGCGIQGNTE